MRVDSSTRFLVHSDSLFMVSIMRELLNELGFCNVDHATESEVALNKLKEGAYGFVLSNWDSPKLPGVGLLRAIRVTPELSHLPFLMFTAEESPGYIDLAMNAGANGFFTWPWKAALLNKKLDEVLTKMKK